jgi:hypothetical protein
MCRQVDQGSLFSRLRSYSKTPWLKNTHLHIALGTRAINEDKALVVLWVTTILRRGRPGALPLYLRFANDRKGAREWRKDQRR